jgi:translation initiation factor IF-2
MTVLEYANQKGISTFVVLDKAQELGFYVVDESDDLDEDLVEMLDEELENYSEEEELEKYEEFEEEEEVKVSKPAPTIPAAAPKKEKKPKKISKAEKRKEQNELNKQKRKDMYKNKEKLISNVPVEAGSEVAENVVEYEEGMTVGELATALDVNATELIKKLMMLGQMATINNTVDYETAELLVADFDKELAVKKEVNAVNFENIEINDNEDLLIERPAVVTIMGHVDHGKTTLLDTIRKSAVTEGEFGGITQHIGAYQITHDGKPITFLDTPGHEAFTAMRARGASVTDIVIIVVAADDGIMPQTREAIDHAKAANVPIIVAVNKMDKPGVNPERVMTEMTNFGLVPEEWGGDIIFAKISALKGEGIDELLENILLITEMEELKANPNRYAMGTVIEAELDKGKGSVATLLVENGTLRIGDPVVVGTSFGKVRTMTDDSGREIVEAGPSFPVEITGLNDVPSAGDKFMAFENEKKARSVAEERATNAKLKERKASSAMSLDELFSQIQEGDIKEINIILKADVQGSVEAVKASLEKIEVEGVRVKVIRAQVGGITEGDVLLASASNALIYGFNVRPDGKTREAAVREKVEIRLHNIIYKAVEEMEAAMKGMLDPEFEEVMIGTAEIRDTFKVSKVGTVAGCFVTEGKIERDSLVRVIRDSIVIYEGQLASLKRFKDDVKEVARGYECGMMVEKYNDLKVGDVIEASVMKEVERK